MAVIHCWVLLGDQGTRKGSVIRSLTGIPREQHCEVMLDNGQYLRLWAAVMSANEPQNAPDANDWVADCAAPPVPAGQPAIVASRINILAAFRLNHGAAGHRAVDYLNALATAGAVIESIVTLGQTTPPWVPSYGAPYAHVLDVSVPTNEIAAHVRRFWGWR